MRSNEEKNLENAANTRIVKDLRGLLNALTVDDLKYVGGLYNVNRLSNVKKRDLVDKMYSVLTDEKYLTRVIERFISREFAMLKSLLNNNGIIQDNNVDMEDYHFLYMLGIVFLFKRDNKFYISMTDDVYNILKSMDLSKFDKLIKDNTKTYNLLRSMIELYGVVEDNEFISAYCYYYGETVYMDIPMNALYFCERYDNISHIYAGKGDFYVSSILRNPKFESILDDIVERQKTIKRKIFSLGELLKYNNYDYYEENESRIKFKIYLKQHGMKKEDIEQCLINITNMFKLGNSFIEGTLTMLEDYGLDFEEKDLQTILDYLMNIYNNTRIWVNNGWTPIELRKSSGL